MTVSDKPQIRLQTYQLTITTQDDYTYMFTVQLAMLKLCMV